MQGHALIANAVQRLRILHIGHRQRAVHRKNAAFDNAHHIKLLHARHHAHRGYVAVGRDYGHLLTFHHPQRIGQILPQHHIKRTGTQFLISGRRQSVAKFRYLREIGRVDAFNLHPAHFAFIGQQRLPRHIRRHTEHTLVLLRHCGQPLPGFAAFGH